MKTHIKYMIAMLLLFFILETTMLINMSLFVATIVTILLIAICEILFDIIDFSIKTKKICDYIQKLGIKYIKGGDEK